MYNDGKPITTEELVKATLGGEHDTSVKMTEMVTNMVLETIDRFRKVDSPHTDGICMTALAVCIGIMQGELEAHGVVPKVADDARDMLLVSNYEAGRDMGLDAHKACAEVRRAADVVKAANHNTARGGEVQS